MNRSDDQDKLNIYVESVMMPDSGLVGYPGYGAAERPLDRVDSFESLPDMEERYAKSRP